MNERKRINRIIRIMSWAVIAILAVWTVIAAQQPKAETVYRLNPEASKAMADLFRANDVENTRHDAAVRDIGYRESLIFKGAGIPSSEWDREMKPDADGWLVLQPRPKAEVKPIPEAKTLQP